MTVHSTDYPRIGESQDHAAPALRRSLSEIVADYDRNAEAIPAAEQLLAGQIRGHLVVDVNR